MAHEAKVSYAVIEAAYRAGLSPDQVTRLFSRAFEREPDSRLTAMLSALFYKTLGFDRAKAWVADAVALPNVTAESIGNVLQGWPDDRRTWNVARDFGPNITDAYWKNRTPHFLDGPRSDLIRSLIMMIRYGRAVEAIQSSLNRLGEIPSKLILRMLAKVIPQINAKRAAPDTMTS